MQGIKKITQINAISSLTLFGRRAFLFICLTTCKHDDVILFLFVNKGDENEDDTEGKPIIVLLTKLLLQLFVKKLLDMILLL